MDTTASWTANDPIREWTEGPKEVRVLFATASRQQPGVSQPDTESRSKGYAPERLEHPGLFRVAGMLKWDGRIVDVAEGGEYFTAELTPLESGPVVLADFPIANLGEEVDPKPGDVIYVTVRQVTTPAGFPTHTSAVRYRRLGNWTDAEVKEIQERALERRNRLRGLLDDSAPDH